jgi:hypothetical protein
MTNFMNLSTMSLLEKRRTFHKNNKKSKIEFGDKIFKNSSIINKHTSRNRLLKALTNTNSQN